MGRRDRSEFAEFAHARAGALHRAAYLMVGDSQLAQDLVQEALTKTYVAWQRAALVLRYYEDLSEAQTAEAMGCAVGTVKSQVSAGLAKLRDRQEPAHPGFAFVAPYQWLDSDTMAVLARTSTSDNDPISLLTCRVSTNACTVTASDIGTLGDVAIAVGEPIGN